MRATVTTGLDRLAAGGAAIAGLQPGARVGLLAHPASIDARGRHAVDLLGGRDDLRLVRLFAPEHGLWGHEQDMEAVGDAIDPASGLPVVSLYGDRAESLRPRPETLADLDAVICDLQDVGTRFYTFVYTVAHVMETAATTDTLVVVCDRPNPLDGVTVEGPVLHPEWSSFVGRYPLPVRHGMTVCELARAVRDVFGVPCRLECVRMSGWDRRRGFEATGLPWVPPSPNMPALSTARVYPGGCLIEGTLLSEGRGTTLPFELVGAPFLDGRALAAELDRRELPGVAFRAASFRPMFQKFAGQGCHGVQVLVRDPAGFRPFRTYLELLDAVRRQAPRDFGWRTEPYEFERDRLAIDLLLGRGDVRPAFESGVAPAELEALWRSELADFRRLRSRLLLYPERA